MEDTGICVTAPTTDGDKPLPCRAGMRGMLPSTWIDRALQLEYVGAAGETRETSAILLDWCPLGIIVNVAAPRPCWVGSSSCSADW
jgi:hypothetical protein